LALWRSGDWFLSEVSTLIFPPQGVEIQDGSHHPRKEKVTWWGCSGMGVDQFIGMTSALWGETSAFQHPKTRWA